MLTAINLMNAVAVRNRKRDREGRSRTACAESKLVAEDRRGQRQRLVVHTGIGQSACCLRTRPHADRTSATTAESGWHSGLEHPERFQKRGRCSRAPIAIRMLCPHPPAQRSLRPTIASGDSCRWMHGGAYAMRFVRSILSQYTASHDGLSMCIRQGQVVGDVRSIVYDRFVSNFNF